MHRDFLVLGVPSADFTCKSRFIQTGTMENILKDCADKLMSAANTIGSATCNTAEKRLRMRQPYL
jgi:hypothetical protein